MADDASFDASPDVLTSAAQGRLRTVIERLERLEEDKAAVMAAVRARGFSPADDNEADAIAILLWAIETDGGVR